MWCIAVVCRVCVCCGRERPGRLLNGKHPVTFSLFFFIWRLYLIDLDLRPHCPM